MLLIKQDHILQTNHNDHENIFTNLFLKVNYYDQINAL